MRNICVTKGLSMLLRILFLITILATPLFAADYEPDEVIEFKKPADGKPLKLFVYKPESPANSKLPCIVFFFGGGWTGGSPRHFFQQSDYFRRRGIVAISAQYRTKSSHKTPPRICVTDGKSAIRWAREHANELGVDPNRIIAGGGSAGGHVAACTGVLEDFEDENDDLKISSKPNAMILFNPVIDTTKKGYGAGKVQGDDKTVLSPVHHVEKGIPSTLIFHGTNDRTVPYENVVRFTRLMNEAGNKCKLISFEGLNHGFFNSSWIRRSNTDEAYAKTMHDSDVWLTELGMIDGSPLPLDQAVVTSTEAEAPTTQKKSRRK